MIHYVFNCFFEENARKYERAKSSGDLFSGKILDVQTKTLEEIRLCSQENKIVGSNGWRRCQSSDLKWKRIQFGKVCLQIKVKFPFDDDQSLATHLVQRGHIVTPTLADGDGDTVEFHRTYFVHTGEVQ